MVVRRVLVLLVVSILLAGCSSVGTATPELEGPLLAVRTVTPGATNTPLPASKTPTLLPVFTATFTPPVVVSPTITPVVGGSLPLCANHDLTVWHGLVSAEGSCHYDHEHKHDPMGSSSTLDNCADDLFGEPGAWFGSPGQSISYFWQTSEENEHKHEAYGWVVRCGIPANSNPNDPAPNYSQAFRVQMHVDAMPFLMPDGTYKGGYLGKQHSFSVEDYVCRKADGECGYIKWGGWLNFGDVELRGPNGDPITQCVPLIDVSPACPNGPGGSKIHFDAAGPPFDPAARSHSFFWYGEQSKSDSVTIEALNPIVIAVAIADHIVDVQLSTLYTPNTVMFCPAMDCQFNGSTISQHELTFNIKANLFDPDGDGFADGVWLLDQYGRFNDQCMSIGQVTPDGLFCIPLIMQHAPVGNYKYGDPENMGIGVDGTQDFDISPAGEWWITWARDMVDGLAEHGH